MYLTVLVFDDVVFPLPDAVAAMVGPQPVTALAEGLRDTLAGSGQELVRHWMALCAWTVLGVLGVVLWFRWE